MALALFEVLTPLHGLRRLGEPSSRPIEVGAIVGLPHSIAVDLLAVDVIAFAAEDAIATVELDFSGPEPTTLIAPNDLQALTAAIKGLGGRVILPFDDLNALVEAVRELGGFAGVSATPSDPLLMGAGNERDADDLDGSESLAGANTSDVADNDLSGDEAKASDGSADANADGDTKNELSGDEAKASDAVAADPAVAAKPARVKKG